MKTHPLKIVGVLSVFMLIGVGVVTQVSEDPLAAWEVAFTCLLLYALIASILSLNTDDQNNYWLFSIIGFVILAAIGGLLAWKISGVSINDAGSIKWMYLVFTFGFLILLTILRTMRKIIEIAQKQDARLRGEQEPLQRKKPDSN